MVDLTEEEFNMVDDQMRYQLKDNKLYVEIAISADLKEVVSDDNLSSSGKTYRVYSNGTNRKFIKEKEYNSLQIQINSYLSVKDSEKL
ncbi:hypothetical protein LCGC14_0888820 [marine sediment metagenome]|uniref:Uncharacterized protein n=1 Tax=marine sediment metagenome TaxID=412755 RepID=A0A0F9P4P8_9ZZZZ|nr:hypothetical protein [archaeon]